MRRIREAFNKPSIDFQILSDLHLEVGQQYDAFTIPRCAPYLVLAGDIGRLIDYKKYLDFLEWQTWAFDLVFLVLGNHEFYGTSYEDGIKAAKKLEQEPRLGGKLILLDQRRYDLRQGSRTVTILGCSLWSHIPDAARDMVAMKVNDFKQIEGWSVDAHNAAHEEESTWLEKNLYLLQTERSQGFPDSSGQETLVVTHHAPTFDRTASPRHAGTPVSTAFATGLLEGEGFDGVNTWVFGHTHYSTDFKKAGMRVVANQRGYVFPGGVVMNNEEGGLAFDVSKTIRVPK